MSLRVAVVGGGIFGCAISAAVADEGHEVTIFERRKRLLEGETSNSVLRLHLGPHYPRDLETARQSVKGYHQFQSEFSNSIDFGFENYYGISRSNSRVKLDEYREFLANLEAPFEEIGPHELSDVGLDPSTLSGLFTSPEGVIDIKSLRLDFEDRFLAREVKVEANVEIVSLIPCASGWTLVSRGEELVGLFDVVVLATYALDQLQMPYSSEKRVKYEFQNTLVLRAELEFTRRIGITVVDGDFLTLLPQAFSDQYLIYAPRPSVLSREKGFQPTETTLGPISEDQWKRSQSDIIRRLQEFFPEQAPKSFIEQIRGKRAIEAGVEKSDRRQTRAVELGSGLLSVMSGKIDHAFIAAELVIKWLGGMTR